MEEENKNILTLAYLNIHGQSGLKLEKQFQIEDFLKTNNIDILHCQEINIDEETFSTCDFISSSYNIVANNSSTKYGTASLVKNEFSIENIVKDTGGRVVMFDIDNMTFGNIYLPSGSDNVSRSSRENYCSEIIPQLLINCKMSGCCGGDFNCISKKEDATKNPESKMSPSLKRLERIFSWQDSFRTLYPSKKCFSRYYANDRHGDGASRIDRSYHFGEVGILQANYCSVAFSDNMCLIVKLNFPTLCQESYPPRPAHFLKQSLK